MKTRFALVAALMAIALPACRRAEAPAPTPTATPAAAPVTPIQKNAFIQKDVPFVLVNSNQVFFPGILVINHELNVGSGFAYSMYLSHVMTALPALLAFKYHSLPNSLISIVMSLPIITMYY